MIQLDPRTNRNIPFYHSRLQEEEEEEEKEEKYQ